jgi:hypothetical protein
MPVTPKKDYTASVVRTVTPLLVGLILAIVGTEVAGFDENTLTPVIAAVVAAVYHAVVRALEEKWPKLGMLLGWDVTPTYTKPGEE